MEGPAGHVSPPSGIHTRGITDSLRIRRRNISDPLVCDKPFASRPLTQEPAEIARVFAGVAFGDVDICDFLAHVFVRAMICVL